MVGSKIKCRHIFSCNCGFVGRMFTNLAIIRRYYIDKWSKKIEEKEEEKNENEKKTVG